MKNVFFSLYGFPNKLKPNEANGKTFSKVQGRFVEAVKVFGTIVKTAVYISAQVGSLIKLFLGVFPIFKLSFWIDHWMASSASQKVWPISNVRKKERKQKRLLWWRVSNWFFTHGNLKGSVSGYTWHLRLSSLPVCYWGPFRKEKVWTSIEDWAPEPRKINTTHCISCLLRKSTK